VSAAAVTGVSLSSSAAAASGKLLHRFEKLFKH
jgi:hypothetical protein